MKLRIATNLVVATMLALAGAASTIAAAHAETTILKADLKGSNEVPPNNSTATGKAEATLDTVTRHLAYTITFSGLSGPVVGAHFHGPGETGKNAGIALPFKTVQSPIEGSATLTENQVADLLAGKWYANLHTAANPGGELRGQMMK
jgi:Cu/Zn superoxide dismutase